MIHPSLFHYFLDVKVPITIAAIYLTSVIFLNRVNQRRQNRPWKVSQTSLFKAFVLCHNISLALFSAWTFYGLSYTLRDCWPSKTEPNFLAHLADSLCRITSSNEPGHSKSFIGHADSWHSVEGPRLSDTYIYILPDSNHLWDHGYAYFSWIFYMSKFYEVVDTFIILAKGKRSSMLQTYHHAGVMICMWAGVRYMSPPSLVGVLLNSAIHTLMVCALLYRAFDFCETEL
jgi:hypothetical protein